MDFLDDICSALAPATALENIRPPHILTGPSTLGFNFGGSESILKKVSLRLENVGATPFLYPSDSRQLDLEKTQFDDASSTTNFKIVSHLDHSTKIDQLTQAFDSEASSHAPQLTAKPSLSGGECDMYNPTQAINQMSEPNLPNPIEAVEKTLEMKMTSSTLNDVDRSEMDISCPTQVIRKNGQDHILGNSRIVDKSTQIDIHNPSQVTQKMSNTTKHDPTQVLEEDDGLELFISDPKSPRPLQPRTRVLSQQHELEMDISNTTLTDDEQDLNPSAYASSHVRDIVTKKGLEEEELLLNLQKRQADIRPEFSRKSTFSKQAFLDAFDKKQEVFETFAAIPSSPPTSPFKESIPPSRGDKSSELPLRNPLDVYAHKLRQQLLSSPTGGDVGAQLIDLDSSDDDASIFSSPLKKLVLKTVKHIVGEIPALTKEQKLAIKQRFSKRKQINSNKGETTKKNGWIAALRKANAQQLKAHVTADPDHAAKRELEKDEEIMGSLLEREMERVRNIRKQEKLRERAALQLTKGRGSTDEPEVDQVPDSDDVPDSEYGSSAASAGEELLDGEDSANEISTKPNRSQIALLSDLESERDSETDLFGDDQVVKYSTRASVPENSSEEDVTPAFSRKDSYQLFQNLPARSQTQLQSQGSQPSIIGNREPMVIPEFEDISDNDPQATPQDTQATQADPVSGSVLFPETQVIAAADQSKRDSEQRSGAMVEDDAVDPKSVREGLEQLTRTQPLFSNATDDSEGEELPEAIQERIKFYEAKIRRKELKTRKRRKEMEQRGFKNMVHGEAEESEDEWHGLGGVDGEISDQANSEDERMIDNNMKIDTNDAEVRRKFMEQYQITDQQELEKLLDDVKNHRLTKRVGVQGLNIELSDEEDELLAAYRRQKWQEQQERLQKNKKVSSFAKNQRVKAFFDSIEESGPKITLDEDVNDDISEILEGEEPPAEHESRVKRTVKLKESFVQKQLSFLTSGTFGDGYEQIQDIARAQEADSTDEDENENWRSLRTQSMSRLAVDRASILVEERPKRVYEDTDEDSDQNLLTLFKRPSIVKSFKSFKEQEGVLIRDGKQFSGVTSNKEYRVAVGSNASIARLTRNTKPSISLQ